MKFERSLGILLLAMSVAVGGCGSDGGGDQASERRGADVEPNYRLTVSVTGLDGELMLGANGEELRVSSNGDFQFLSEFPGGARVSVAVLDDPQNQQCIVLGDESFIIGENNSNVQVACSGLGLVRGIVKDYRTGNSIANASMSVHRYGGSVADQIADFVTDENGGFFQGGLGLGDRIVLTGVAPGYASHSVIVSNSSDDPIVDVVVYLLPANTVETFSPENEHSIVIDGLEIASLPAYAFVDENGVTVTENVVATVTVLDPSGNPQLMMGDYQALTDDGPRMLETFGAVDFRFETQDGRSLQLAQDKTATIAVPLASASSPDTLSGYVPMFYFDIETGYWREEGTGALGRDGDRLFYVAEVSHFTTWNADAYFDSVQLLGCVEDESGGPVKDVSVTAAGRDYIGFSFATSDNQGQFELSVKPNSFVLVSGSHADQTNTIVVEVGDQNQSIGQCLVLARATATIGLTWLQLPEDLDAFLFLPESLQAQGGMVFYGNQVVTTEGGSISLDVDDTDSFGPEVITMIGLSAPGTYSYMVENYSEDAGFKVSGARVELAIGGSAWVFSADAATGEYEYGFWHVMDLVVSQDGNVTVVPVQRLRTEEDVLGQE